MLQIKQFMKIMSTNFESALWQAKVNALRELQSAGGEELRPFVGRTLMPSALDRAFKGKLLFL